MQLLLQKKDYIKQSLGNGFVLYDIFANLSHFDFYNSTNIQP